MSYRLGSASRRRKKWPLWTGLVIFLVIAGVVLWLLMHLSSHTTVSQSKAVVTKVKATNGTLKTFDETDFQLALPFDWTKLPRAAGNVYNLYQYRNGGKTPGMQEMDVYQDVMPEKFAVNRLVVVEPNLSQLTVTGEVSDNCSTFTKSTATVTVVGTPAKWNGVDFLCDLANTQRSVVGTGTEGAINTTVLKGSDGQSHKFFFTYTDNDITPKSSIFVNALTSFHVK